MSERIWPEESRALPDVRWVIRKRRRVLQQLWEVYGDAPGVRYEWRDIPVTDTKEGE